MWTWRFRGINVLSKVSQQLINFCCIPQTHTKSICLCCSDFCFCLFALPFPQYLSLSLRFSQISPTFGTSPPLVVLAPSFSWCCLPNLCLGRGEDREIGRAGELEKGVGSKAIRKIRRCGVGRWRSKRDKEAPVLFLPPLWNYAAQSPIWEWVRNMSKLRNEDSPSPRNRIGTPPGQNAGFAMQEWRHQPVSLASDSHGPPGSFVKPKSNSLSEHHCL